MFGKDGLYFFVRRDLTASYGRKRLVDCPKFLRRCVVNTVPSRLDFESDLRKLILIVLRPMLDPRKYVSHMRVHEA